MGANFGSRPFSIVGRVAPQAATIFPHLGHSNVDSLASSQDA